MEQGGGERVGKPYAIFFFKWVDFRCTPIICRLFRPTVNVETSQKREESGFLLEETRAQIFGLRFCFPYCLQCFIGALLGGGGE